MALIGLTSLSGSRGGSCHAQTVTWQDLSYLRIEKDRKVEECGALLVELLPLRPHMGAVLFLREWYSEF